MLGRLPLGCVPAMPRHLTCSVQPFGCGPARGRQRCRGERHMTSNRELLNCASFSKGLVCASSVVGPAAAAPLVDELLHLVDNTDGGDVVSPAVRRRADACLAQLESIGQGTKPLENPLIFGNYNVAYVSTGSKQYGQPAGGRFRTGPGKLLFRTRRLCQSVFPPDVVTNKVEFALFGFLRGAVGLRGRLVSVPEDEGGPDEKDTAKVFFDPPVLSLPGGIHVRIGPPSSVVLKTTYLDERVRLGKGSRGSLFVFTRGGGSSKAGMAQVGLQRSSPGGIALLAVALGALVLGGGWLLASPQAPAPAKAAGLVALLVGSLLAGVFYRGGIMDASADADDRPEVQPPTAAAA